MYYTYIVTTYNRICIHFYTSFVIIRLAAIKCYSWRESSTANPRKLIPIVIVFACSLHTVLGFINIRNNIEATATRRMRITVPPDAFYDVSFVLRPHRLLMLPSLYLSYHLRDNCSDYNNFTKINHVGKRRHCFAAN